MTSRRMCAQLLQERSRHPRLRGAGEKTTIGNSARKHDGLCFNPSTHVKKNPGLFFHQSQRWGGRERRVPKTCWPVCLSELISLDLVSELPQNISLRMTGEDIWCQPLSSMCTYANVLAPINIDARVLSHEIFSSQKPEGLYRWWTFSITT